MTKEEATSEARKIAEKAGWCFIIECFDGTWYASTSKPSLRSGKVFELRKNGEGLYYA